MLTTTSIDGTPFTPLEVGSIVAIQPCDGAPFEVRVSRFGVKGTRHSRKAGVDLGDYITVLGDDLWQIEGRTINNELICKAIKHHRDSCHTPSRALIPDQRDWFAPAIMDPNFESGHSAAAGLNEPVTWSQEYGLEECFRDPEELDIIGLKLSSPRLINRKGTWTVTKVGTPHPRYHQAKVEKIVINDASESQTSEVVVVNGHIDTSLDTFVDDNQFPEVYQLHLTSTDKQEEIFVDARTVEASWAYTEHIVESVRSHKRRERKRKRTEESDQFLYRLFNEAGDLLYIGISQTPFSRWKQHRRTAPWMEEVTTFKTERFRTREEVAAAEKAAILFEHPLYNRQHNLVK